LDPGRRRTICHRTRFGTRTARRPRTVRVPFYPSTVVSGDVKKFVVPAVVDVLLVLVFCVIGRRNHDEANAVAGLASTAWPFLGGLVAGWIAALRLHAEPVGLYPFGVSVWFGAVAGGMVLRVIGGQGTAFSFIIVASIVLAIFLIGWRALATFVGRRRMAGQGTP
jgi:hypothetical protein